MIPRALTIAGFDPSGGAGVLADVKMLEHFRVYGQSAITSITYQSSTEILGVKWLDAYEIISQLQALERDSLPKLVKIGIIKDFATLEEVLGFLADKVDFIIYDPIIRASSGYLFWKKVNRESLARILEMVDLITPNLTEYEAIADILGAKPEEYTNVYCKSVKLGVDVLYMGELRVDFEDEATTKPAKHGSGCVLSSAIMAHLALGFTLEDSCRKAKQYLNKFLDSDPGLLGVHW